MYTFIPEVRSHSVQRIKSILISRNGYGSKSSSSSSSGNDGDHNNVDTAPKKSKIFNNYGELKYPFCNYDEEVIDDRDDDYDDNDNNYRASSSLSYDMKSIFTPICVYRVYLLRLLFRIYDNYIEEMRRSSSNAGYILDTSKHSLIDVYEIFRGLCSTSWFLSILEQEYLDSASKCHCLRLLILFLQKDSIFLKDFIMNHGFYHLFSILCSSSSSSSSIQSLPTILPIISMLFHFPIQDMMQTFQIRSIESFTELFHLDECLGPDLNEPYFKDVTMPLFKIFMVCLTKLCKIVKNDDNQYTMKGNNNKNDVDARNNNNDDTDADDRRDDVYRNNKNSNNGDTTNILTSTIELLFGIIQHAMERLNSFRTLLERREAIEIICNSMLECSNAYHDYGGHIFQNVYDNIDNNDYNHTSNASYNNNNKNNENNENSGSCSRSNTNFTTYNNGDDNDDKTSVSGKINREPDLTRSIQEHYIYVDDDRYDGAVDDHVNHINNYDDQINGLESGNSSNIQSRKAQSDHDDVTTTSSSSSSSCTIKTEIKTENKVPRKPSLVRLINSHDNSNMNHHELIIIKKHGKKMIDIIISNSIYYSINNLENNQFLACYLLSYPENYPTSYQLSYQALIIKIFSTTIDNLLCKKFEPVLIFHIIDIITNIVPLVKANLLYDSIVLEIFQLVLRLTKKTLDTKLSNSHDRVKNVIKELGNTARFFAYSCIVKCSNTNTSIEAKMINNSHDKNSGSSSSNSSSSSSSSSNSSSRNSSIKIYSLIQENLSLLFHASLDDIGDIIAATVNSKFALRSIGMDFSATTIPISTSHTSSSSSSLSLSSLNQSNSTTSSQSNIIFDTIQNLSTIHGKRINYTVLTYMKTERNRISNVFWVYLIYTCYNLVLEDNSALRIEATRIISYLTINRGVLVETLLGNNTLLAMSPVYTNVRKWGAKQLESAEEAAVRASKEVDIYRDGFSKLVPNASGHCVSILNYYIVYYVCEPLFVSYVYIYI
jgi:hypothetical protein